MYQPPLPKPLSNEFVKYLYSDFHDDVSATRQLVPLYYFFNYADLLKEQPSSVRKAEAEPWF